MTSSDAPRRVSFIIPAKDEEQRLGASLQELIAFAEGQPYDVEIIVVDDGSTDGTAEVARGAASGLPQGMVLRLLQHETNRGKGAALRTGVLEAAGDYILQMDADMAMPPEESPKLVAALSAGADVAAGSRVQPGGFDMRASQPAYRRIGGRLFTIARRRLLLPDIKDTQCGFKGFRREAARDIYPRTHVQRWSFDLELLYVAKRLGYRVEQVPVRWEHKEGSQFRLGLSSAIGELSDLLRIRWLHRGLKPRTQ